MCKEEKPCKSLSSNDEGWIILSSLDPCLMCTCGWFGFGWACCMHKWRRGTSWIRMHKEKAASTQVGKEPAHTKRSGIHQVKTVAPYNSGKNPFRFLGLFYSSKIIIDLGLGMGSGHWVFNYFSFIKPTPLFFYSQGIYFPDTPPPTSNHALFFNPYSFYFVLTATTHFSFPWRLQDLHLPLIMQCGSSYVQNREKKRKRKKDTLLSSL